MAETKAIQAKIKMNLTPTLIIMEGSTAGKIGYRIKQLMRRHYGDLSVVRFLWIDTDVNIPEGAQNKFTPEERAEMVGYNANTVLKNLENYPTIKSWWPSSVNVQPGMISKGAAQQMRLIGRLSLFRMFDEATNGPSFISKLKQAAKSIHEIENIDATRRKSNDRIHYDVNDNSTRVIFIFSTCGGTGSSLSFDIAYLCRHFLKGLSPTMMAVSILPPVIDQEIRDESALQRQKIRANTYAWFKEDQYLMANPNWYVTYPGMAPVDIPSAPFDLHFLVDMVNEKNNRLDEAEDVYKMISQAIFLDTGTAIAGENSSFFTNVGVLDRYVKGRKQAYSAIASASIVYPAERLLSFCAHRFAENMITKGLIGEHDPGLVQTEIATMHSELGLRDDALVRTLRENRGVPLLKKAAILKSDSVKKANHLLRDQKQITEITLEKETASIEQTGEALLGQYKSQLETRITAMLMRYGLANARGMLLALQAPEGTMEAGPVVSLAVMQQRIAQQGFSEADIAEKQRLHSQKIQRLSEMDGNLLRNAQQAILHKKWSQVFNERKHDCLTSLEQTIEAQLVFAAQKTARDIYSQLLTFLQNRLTELAAIEQSILLVRRNLAQVAAERLAPHTPAEGSFELNREVLGHRAYFEAFYKEKASSLMPKTLYQRYSESLNAHHLTSLQNWAETLLEKELVQHAENQFREAIEETSLLDAAKAYYGDTAKDKIGEMMDNLLTYCSPFWQFERDWGRSTQEGKSIIGVEDNHHLLIPDRFRQNQQYNMVSTGFKHRIDVVRVRHGLPAFLLKDMDEYKAMYDQVRQSTKDPLQILPNASEFEDIFPDEHKESRQMFALGLVFDLIVQIGSFYYLDLKKEYTGPHQIKPTSEYRLAQGRSNAEQALIHKPQYRQAIAEAIEKQVQKIGNQAAITMLEEAIIQLKKHISSLPVQNEEMRPQLQREVTYLRDYQRTLGAIIETN